MKDFVYFGAIALYFVVLYILPDIFGGSRNPYCQMNTALANLLFGLIIMGG